MTKKKRRQNPEAEELLARPWCYYCERDFDDLKILIAHQKAKHYKCERCGRRLNTAGGLRVHMEQVHKEQLEAVDNAIPGRESIELEIFGTEGIPESEVAAHNQRILAVVAQREADRRAASGQSGSGSKKPKLDISQELDPENIKKKLEAHKKAMAAGQNSGSTGGTPVPPGNMSPGRSASPGQAGFDGQRSPAQAGFPQTASPPYQQGGYPMSQQPTGPYPASQTYPAQNPPPTYGAPYHAAPFQQPPASFGRGTPPTGPGYNGFQPPPHQGFGPGYNPNPHNQYQQPPPAHLPRPPASSSLPQPHQIPGLPPRPSAPGLPPRPNFGNAAINNGGFGRGGAGGWNQPPAHQQQMYPQAASPPNIAGFGGSGAYVPPPPGQNQQSFAQPYPPQQQQQQQQQQSGFGAPPPPSPATHGMPQYPQPHNVSSGPNGQPRNDNRQLAAAGVEEVIRVKVDTPNNGTPEVAPPPTTEKKKEEKPKRETRMAYSDNEISPEEKRAMLPRYEYHPPKSSVEAATTA